MGGTEMDRVKDCGDDNLTANPSPKVACKTMPRYRARPVLKGDKCAVEHPLTSASWKLPFYF
jgi:hypothetical protein